MFKHPVPAMGLAHSKEIIPMQTAAIGVNVNVAQLAGESKSEFWLNMKDLTRRWLTRAIEAVLDYEATEFVGAGWHERNAPDRRTYRSGYRRRRFAVLGHELSLRMPHTRIAGFRSEFIEFFKRRNDDFDQAIVNAYVAGASMREITALFYQMFGTSISPGTISTLIEALDAECDAFQTRALTNDYAFLVLDAMYVRCMVAPAAKLKGAKDGESVQKVAVLLVRGIKLDGTRELIDFRLAAGEREAAWEAFLLSLYQRGLEAHDTMVFVHDGSEGLENAIASVYGIVERQRCICHKLGNLWDAVEDKSKHSSIRKHAAKIYDVDTIEQAHKRLASFKKKWKRIEPRAVGNFSQDFEQTLTFLKVPREHRKWITTTNAIERYIRELRRRTRPMNTFQSLESCRRLIYAAIKKLSDERRNDIPFSLWPSQPYYGSRSRKQPPKPKPDLDMLRKDFFNDLIDWTRI